MTTAYAIRTLEKKTGLKVFTKDNHRYSLTGTKDLITWFDQGGDVQCLHKQGKHEESDAMTDYFPGSFYESIPSILYSFDK